MKQHLQLTQAQWETFLASLYERDDRLERRAADQTYSADEAADAYVLSAHAEAMQSAEVDGDLWGTLADIEASAATEQEAWQTIKAFYLERGCVVIEVTGGEEAEEWIFAGPLAARLGLE